jgi:prevent-host-death family protein
METYMPRKTIASREFNQDLAAAKRAAREGPVIVTDRGEPAFVLLSYEEYRRLAGQTGRSLADLLHQDEGADIRFEPPRLKGLFRPTEPA